MTFWDFAANHPWMTLALGALVLFIVDAATTNIANGIAAIRKHKDD